MTEEYNTHGLLLSPLLVEANMANAVPNAINPQAKTQTRRNNKLHEINKNPDRWRLDSVNHDPFLSDGKASYAIFKDDMNVSIGVHSPYGIPGDLLYFKEQHYCMGYWEETSELTKKKKRKKMRFVPSTVHDPQFNDNCRAELKAGREKNVMGWYNRVSMFMPTSYARQWAILEDIYPERLCSISAKDAIEEGIEPIEFAFGVKRYKDYSNLTDSFADPENSFFSLYHSVNQKGHYDPWVWVVKYRPLSFDGRPSEYTIKVAREELFEVKEKGAAPC